MHLRKGHGATQRHGDDGPFRAPGHRGEDGRSAANGPSAGAGGVGDRP
jgi:hypothetical protein